MIRLDLCDYEERTVQFQGSDEDTLSFNVKLNLIFEFNDDFEDGAVNWTTGCPNNFADSSSHDGSNFVVLSNDGECSTRLIPTFELPTCLVPSVSFWYRLPSVITAEMRIDADAGSYYERLQDQKQAWTRVEIPTEDLQALVGTATFTFNFSPAENDTFRFSLDDFSINAE